MRILVFGAGVLGCNLARNFARAGKEVTLLARGQWAEEIQQNGLRIRNQLLPHTSVTRLPVITALSLDAAFDVVFVAIRYTQLETVVETLQKSQAKTIVFVGNNLRPAALPMRLPGKNVLFAFSTSAGHRENNRVVSVDLRKITIGPLHPLPSAKALVDQIFAGTKYRVTFQANMEDYLLCHAAFVVPATFACYKTDGNLKKLEGNTAYLNRVIDANIEGYRAIQRAGHEILPDEDKAFEGAAYRQTCMRFFKLLCATKLGKLCVSDHAMSAVDEMSALNRDLKRFYDENGADYPTWRALEKECGQYLK